MPSLPYYRLVMGFTEYSKYIKYIIYNINNVVDAGHMKTIKYETQRSLRKRVAQSVLSKLESLSPVLLGRTKE